MAILRIEEILREQGIGVTELADRLNVNRQTVYYYIKQDDKNPLAQLQKIADALKINVIELFANTTSSAELTALIDHRGDFYKANTLKELEEIVAKIKNSSKDYL